MSRKPFAPMVEALDPFAEDDRKLNDYAERAGIPSLKTVEPKRDAARTKTGRVWFEMPDYVVKDLKRLAFERQCSVRSLMLQALHDSGMVAVDGDDLVPDRRSLRKV